MNQIYPLVLAACLLFVGLSFITLSQTVAIVCIGVALFLPTLLLFRSRR